MNEWETVFCTLFLRTKGQPSFSFYYIKIKKECKLNSVLMDGAQ